MDFPSWPGELFSGQGVLQGGAEVSAQVNMSAALLQFLLLLISICSPFEGGGMYSFLRGMVDAVQRGDSLDSLISFE